MELNKQRKVYIGILALAGLALGVDRFVLDGGPASARAASPAVATVGSAGMMPAGSSAPVRAVAPRQGALDAPLAALARRIERLPREAGAPADAFSVPASWPGAVDARAKNADGPGAAAVAVVNVPYRLTSVTGQTAVITIENQAKGSNVRILRLDGKARNGMRLVSLAGPTKENPGLETQAVIEVGGQTFTLPLRRPELKGEQESATIEITPHEPTGS